MKSFKRAKIVQVFDHNKYLILLSLQAFRSQIFIRFGNLSLWNSASWMDSYKHFCVSFQVAILKNWETCKNICTSCLALCSRILFSVSLFEEKSTRLLHLLFFLSILFFLKFLDHWNWQPSKSAAEFFYVSKIGNKRIDRFFSLWLQHDEGKH